MSVDTMRRRHFLRAVIIHAEQTGNLTTPWSGLAGMELYFSDSEQLLVELHREWVRALVSRLHHGAIVAARSAAEVRELYREVARENPVLRAVLDAHVANPVLWEPMHREFGMLARIAGLTEDIVSPEVTSSRGRALVSAGVPAQRAASA